MSTEPLEPETPKNPLPSCQSFWSLKNNPAIIAHAILTGTLVVATILIALGLYYFDANRIDDRWSETLDQSLDDKLKPGKIDLIVNNYLQKYQNLNIDGAKKRIKEQLTQMVMKQKQSEIIAKDYYKWLFVDLSITSGAAIISAISLFYISKEGWEKANNYVINIFTTSSAVALMVGSWNVIFKMQENADKKVDLFIAYENLYNLVLTRIATISDPSEAGDTRCNPSEAGDTRTSPPTVADQLQTIVTKTEDTMSTYNKILINFDSSGIRLPYFLLNNSSGLNESGGNSSGGAK